MLAQLNPHRPASLPKASVLHQSSSLRQNFVETVPPIVVDANLTHQFKYWNNGVQQGMRYNHELFTHHHSYAPEERLKAYAAGFELTDLGRKVCITVSAKGYSVWCDLHAEQGADSETERAIA
ncbi:MAG: hypothetical protein KME16_13985 [Scytolyngbya sp. HA4215-MV1]|nr:hypothetical protein [Scytolyngbya sp. HA4215-MV1]